MKRFQTTLTILLFLAAFNVNAQLSKTDADNLVLNTIVNDTTKDVYSLYEIICRGNNIMTADGREIQNPYDNAYVYFIDESPTAYWAHSCKYCYVDITSNEYSLINSDMYPDNFKKYQRMSNIYAHNSIQWDENLIQRDYQTLPDAHQWAVLICSYSNENIGRFWGDLSCVYTTLTNCYGFIENTSNNNGLYFNHIIVFAQDGVLSNRPLDLNNSGGCSNNDFITQNFVYAGDNCILYNKASIETVFDNFAGRSTSLSEYGYRALDSLDRLFVYVTGHGHTSNNHSFINTGINETIYDNELADMVRDINCSQMTFLLQSCYSGGFIDDLSNTTNAKCKNRVIQTATSNNRYSHCESYINYVNSPSWPTRDSYDDFAVGEFTYYWCSALLGYYPIIRLNQNPIIGPWNVYNNNIIGSFPWDTFFIETSTLNHIPYDVSPDTDNDGIISMDEAYVFARKLDSWDTLGYYNPYYPYEENYWVAAEYPQSYYESPFTKELITLDGYKGTINGDVETGSDISYILDGDVGISGDASLLINDGCHFKGRTSNYTFTNAGVVADNDVDTMSFSNVKIDNNNAHRFSLSNCVFDTCVRVNTCDGPFSLTNCTFNNSYVWLEEIPQCFVYGNFIRSDGDGIFIKHLNGSYNNYVFSDNIVQGCGGSGFVSYNSNAKLLNNDIWYNSADGIRSLNYSNLYVKGDSLAEYMHETQRVLSNGRHQVYATIDSHPVDFHFNVLSFTGIHDTILNFEASNNNRPVTYNATKNCWYPLSDNEISSHLYTGGLNTYSYLPTWEPLYMPVTPPTPPQELLAKGDALAVNGDYYGASETYMQLIGDYHDSPEAIAALKALFAVEVESQGNFADIKDYYSDLSSDVYLSDAAENLANRCDVQMRNYSDAIEWYENKIVDPNALYSERVFAEIDLGDLYLNMNDNGIRGVHGKMAQYIPESKNAHALRTEYLLSTLPGKTTLDRQAGYECPASEKHIGTVPLCSPNPANGKVLLTFDLETDSNVDIKLFNTLGNEVKHRNIGWINGGTHTYEVDLYDMPDGLYYCSISTTYGITQSLKILVKH